jgi:hypothetical protein
MSTPQEQQSLHESGKEDGVSGQPRFRTDSNTSAFAEMVSNQAPLEHFHHEERRLITYSRGLGPYDNTPDQRTAPDFAAFREAVLADRAAAKGRQWIASAFSIAPDNAAHRASNSMQAAIGKSHRCKECAQVRRWIGLDVDHGLTPESFAALVLHLKQYSGLVYTTSSHTPTSPRCRVVLELDLALPRAELIQATKAIQMRIDAMMQADGYAAVTWDSGCDKPEQPLYLPLEKSETHRLDGTALSARELLTNVPAVREEAPAQTVKAPAMQADAYALGAMDKALRMIEVAPEGQRNDVLNRESYSLGGFVGAGRLSYDMVFAGLSSAVEHANWTDPEGNCKKIHAGIAAGAAKPRHDGASALSDDAPQPLPSPLPPVPTFDPAMLPVSVRDWCIDAADGLQVPLDFTGVPAMVALAGTIGRKVAVAMKQHDHWAEVPMLWGCVVGRPSSGKSPALHPARRMLERLASNERASYDAKMREYEARELVAEATKANAKKAIQAALKKNNVRSAEAAAEAALSENERPSEPRIVVNDATVEKLGELLNANPRGLVQFRDELAGWLASLDREGREGDRAFWLECWNGSGSFTVDRIGRGTVRIEACAMSILGGMQPGKLAEYVRGAIRGGFSDDGLIQRFQLAVYPDLPANWTYTDRPLDPEAERMAWATFQRLRDLDPDEIGAERADWLDVPFLRFDDEAQNLLIEWQTMLMQRLRAGDEPAWMESHLSKYRALAGRLALVLHLADHGTGPISAVTLSNALNWCDYLEGHARRIYAPATESGLTAAHLILKRRNDLAGDFTGRDIQRRGWAGLSDRDAIGEALDLLVEHRYLSAIEKATGGRPSVIYAWNAAV